MILVDANILIYAYNDGAEQHDQAKQWLEDVFSSNDAVRLSLCSILTFLRLTTQRPVMAHPYSMTEASQIVDAWLDLDNVDVLQPGNRHWQILRNVLVNAQIRGSMVSDAHLAALAIEHGATLYTTDKDFSRFDGLRVVNPLVG